MKKILIILSTVLIMSCNKDDEKPAGVLFYAGIEFSVVNSENEDLLNPETLDRINESDIKVFYEIEGEKVEFYKTVQPMAENTKGFRIYEHENEFRIGIFLNHTETYDKPITYVYWNENDIDTIEATFKRPNGSIIQEAIWLNGKKVWELGDNTTDPFFTLIK